MISMVKAINGHYKKGVNMKRYLLAITKNIPGETTDYYFKAENMKEAIKKAEEHESVKDSEVEKIEVSEVL